MFLYQILIEYDGSNCAGGQIQQNFKLSFEKKLNI